MLVVTQANRRDLINVETSSGISGESLSDTFPHQSLKRTKEAATKLAVSTEFLREVMHEWRAAPEPTPNGCPPRIASVLLRGMHQSAGNARGFEAATQLDALQLALGEQRFPAVEPVIEWADRDELALLDVDFHSQVLHQRPSHGQLNTIARMSRPQPAIWWISHGHGLHAVFTATGDLTADEVAAFGAASAKRLAPTSAVEILTRTRHPGDPRPDYPDAGSIHDESAVEVGSPFLDLSNGVEAAQIDDWLVEHGMQRGRSYSHQCCPADPTAGGDRDPVFAGDDGIFCHCCEARGIALAGGRPGYFPYLLLITGGHAGLTAAAARNFVHWQHAQFYVIHEFGLVGDAAKSYYTAALKLRHGAEDPRVGRAMSRGTGLVRCSGYWSTPDLTTEHPNRGLTARVGSLAAVRYLVDGGDEPIERVDDEKLGIFLGIDDLSRKGYAPLKPMRGLQIANRWSPETQSPTSVSVPTQPAYLAADEKRAYRPRYLPTASRSMDLSHAEGIIARD